MSNNTELSIAAVRAQVDTYAKGKWPWLTQKQRDTLADKLLAQIGAETLKNSVKLSTLDDVNAPTLDFFVMEDASLVRVVPSAAAVIAHQLKEMEELGQTITPETKLNTARSVAAMSEDERLAALPYSPDDKPDSVEAVAPAPIKPKSNGGAALSDEEIADAMGIPVYQIKASDRRRFQEAAKHVPQGQHQNALDANQLGQIERDLSPTERLTKFRAEQALKKSA